jgi:Ala-tRNA(Pro) deacylase
MVAAVQQGRPLPERRDRQRRCGGRAAETEGWRAMQQMAPRLRQILDAMEVPYRVFGHRPTASASETAEAAHIAGGRLVKAVLLEDRQGMVLAVLASTQHVDLDLLNGRLGRELDLVPEMRIRDVFVDCAPGALPPAGVAYGIPVVMDTSLDLLDEVFVEGGDHRHVVALAGRDFRAMMRAARRASFAVAGPVHAGEPAAEPTHAAAHGAPGEDAGTAPEAGTSEAPSA